MAQIHYITVEPNEDIFSARRRWAATAPAGYRGNMFFRFSSVAPCAARPPLPHEDPHLIPVIGDPFNPADDFGAALSAGRA